MVERRALSLSDKFDDEGTSAIILIMQWFRRVRSICSHSLSPLVKLT
jgi:hypothetical protein